jgi:flagellar biosynthesis/type III secretory pathway chaperone
MMPSIKDLQRVAALLDEHIVEARRMLDILQREQKALASSDLASFERALEQKQQQAGNIDSIERRLQALGNINGAPFTLKSFVRFVEQSGLAPLQSRWTNLQDVLRQCQRQNLVNHRIVEASRENIRQSLDILHGKTSSPETYVASGRTRIDAAGRFLAVA